MELTQGWHHPHKLRIIVLGRLVAGKVKTITHVVPAQQQINFPLRLLQAY